MSGHTYKTGHPWLVIWQYFTSESVKHRSQLVRCCFNRDDRHVLLVYYLELEMISHAYVVEVNMHDIYIHFLEIFMCVIFVWIVCVFVFIFYPLLIIYHVHSVKCISLLSFLYDLVWLICRSSLGMSLKSTAKMISTTTEWRTILPIMPLCFFWSRC